MIANLDAWYDEHTEELSKRRLDGGISHKHYERMLWYYGEVYLRQRLRYCLVSDPSTRYS